MKTFTFEKLNELYGWLHYQGKRMLLSVEETNKLKDDRDVEAIWDWRWEDKE